ncbi:MAG: hypothetical protein ACXQS4_03790 [Methermicoccaceae archaeon]
MSYPTTEVEGFMPLCQNSLRATCPEFWHHEMFRAGSPQPLTDIAPASFQHTTFNGYYRQEGRTPQFIS